MLVCPRQPCPEPGRCSDPAQAAFWRGRWLRYSGHALAQACARNIPILGQFPADIRLADLDLGPRGPICLRFKVMAWDKEGEDVSFFVEVCPSGRVITTYRNTGEYAEKQKKKRDLRALLLRGDTQR